MGGAEDFAFDGGGLSSQRRRSRTRRKLRPLVITMGSTREELIRKLFSEPPMASHFEMPVFSPGIPSRSLRNISGLLKAANDAGILPPEEWEAVVRAAGDVGSKAGDPFGFLEGVPVRPGRRGAPADVKLHYGVELWRKAKGLNRGRSVLACSLAHLIAMRKLVEDGYDFILEDNVRCPIGKPRKESLKTDSADITELSAETYCECAERIWDAIEASDAAARDDGWGGSCHLRYYGWLGSLTNLEWVINTHAKRTAFFDGENGYSRESSGRASVFPFPLNSDLDIDLENGEEKTSLKTLNEVEEGEAEGGNVHRKPGGTLVWGAYAYWISSDGLEAVLASLRNDVGALLWKGKRMRCYSVKPIDKIMPRRVIEHLGRNCVHASSAPAFFRAPMLTSKIHQQWDAEFCRSTQYQMEADSQRTLLWRDLWLSEEEREIVDHHEKHGIWLSMPELSKLKSER